MLRCAWPPCPAAACQLCPRGPLPRVCLPLPGLFAHQPLIVCRTACLPVCLQPALRARSSAMVDGATSLDAGQEAALLAAVAAALPSKHPCRVLLRLLCLALEGLAPRSPVSYKSSLHCPPSPTPFCCCPADGSSARIARITPTADGTSVLTTLAVSVPAAAAPCRRLLQSWSRGT